MRMAKKTAESGILQKAAELLESGVDYRVFHNTFFGPEAELLAGLTRVQRARLVASALYRQLQDMAVELGVDQGYLERDAASGEARERRYSGSFVMRLPSSLHRQLAVEARREGVSLNQLCTAKLARPLSE